MVARLKLTSKLIPWYLLLKAIALGAAWVFLPFWVFLLFAIYFYFSSFFQSAKLFWPFLLTLAFAYVFEPTFPHAVFFGAAFFLIFGIKDLAFINRLAAYEILAFLLLFLLSLNFFLTFGSWGNSWIFLASLAASVIFFILAKGLVDYGEFSVDRAKKIAGIGVAAFLLWQLSWAAIFLPINPFYQAALVFLLAAIFLDLLLDYFAGRLTRERIFAEFILFIVFGGLIFFGTQWSL